MNESPLHCLDRLLTALETLAAEENVLLRASEFAAAASLAERMQPLLDRLAELARTPALAGRLDTALRARAAALRQHRLDGLSLLGVRMAEVKARLRVVLEAQALAGRLRPVYGSRRQATASGFAANG